MILHNDAVAAINRIQDKSNILIFLRKLERYPATQGDHYELDPKGNPIQFKILKRYVMIYYHDPFANEMRILDIKHAEHF